MPTTPPLIEAPLTLGAQIEARSRHPDVADRPLLRQEGRLWTYRAFRDEAVRYAHFLLARLGTIDDARPGHVAMLMENHLELLALYGGCGYAGLTLFGINTGMRGDTLVGLLDQSRARMLVVDERLLPQVESVRGQLEHIAPENILVVPTSGETDLSPEQSLPECIAAEVAKEGESLDAPDVEVTPETNLMVIYTSGTTGLPKGINNNHLKLMAIGFAISRQLDLTPDDCGYACMPLFHSNAMFLGFQPAFVSGASLALRERFSASNFVPDVFRYGVSFWNYVGEPLHYILAAIDQRYGGDAERIRSDLTEHPDNRLRYALGNGASPPDIDRFAEWLGLEDVFELYGSTEAAISTFRRKGDPRGSVGQIADPAVKILNEDGDECPAAVLAEDGKITNYREAVGEISRVADNTSLFQGYFQSPEADASKYRDGVYYSGDLGHVQIVDDKRYLFFDGRTNDWIRKDGENFSAAQVARLLLDHPDVVLAAAYGVPCPVSDEWVMAALKLRSGATFDPQGFFDFCELQINEGAMDRKWFPDFVRIVDEFPYTQTQKILVRQLKREHFDRRGRPGEPIYRRSRSSTAFEVFSADDFEELRGEFEAAERGGLLAG